MTTQNAMDFDALANALASLGQGDAMIAELHGALCGALCVQAPAQVELTTLVEWDAPLDALRAQRATLEALRAQTFDALTDEALSFTPLLPDDEASLTLRTQALAQWCQGFLFGMASKPGLDLKRASEDVQEVVRDLTELTRAATAEEGEDLEVEEGAYAELVEYVRVGAQMVFMELHPHPTLDPSAPQQLH
ncbi:UPF0149 family protein [Sinimarinibacterium sp. NLF-5-8]|uniref:UPF0149 family protein n=1 Tax=Sinimarinibacterium sp. NLF-5-8 TaxID=2698684 RepID=UPI00137C1E95|nr:UPF0149 family protein [Sinimarinibacterium sp. NLF-5-8]QHS10126.1 UPF0149 family protein [Sinimarinibacterium sp. NLF-5-8]